MKFFNPAFWGSFHVFFFLSPRHRSSIKCVPTPGFIAATLVNGGDEFESFKKFPRINDDDDDG